MDVVNQYEEIIQSYAADWDQASTGVKSQIIIDAEGKHYQSLRIGWKNEEEYIHSCIFHFDIIDGKIWIQENRTDILIAEELVKQGVEKKDIVLGMLPPEMRKDSEYAAA